ncbi:MAG: threonine dehydrogenase-like Zn-dependent dehydrogenase [Planctomycetota bacterium]|jgi:threonine dehydrogenase-like Zn-dependent dehydrogenase
MSSALESEAYWIREPGVGALQREEFSSQLEPGTSLVESKWSAVSPGTERLVGLGQVPMACTEFMACRYMGGSFSLPLKYGYCLVGTVLDGAQAGKSVFVMHPHQDLIAVRDEDLTVLPEELPVQRAGLIPNLETALNAVWDAELSPEEDCVVFGAGSVGLLISYVLWNQTGRPVQIVEIDEKRRAFAATLPWGVNACAPSEVLAEGLRVAFHTTGNPAGLQAALDCVDFEGRVIELSWYGSKSVTLDLGTHFHYGRKRIIASQVGKIAVSHRASHDYSQRIGEVLALLNHPKLDSLLGSPVPFKDMPQFMKSLYRGESTSPLPLIDYGKS